MVIISNVKQREVIEERMGNNDEVIHYTEV